MKVILTIKDGTLECAACKQLVKLKTRRQLSALLHSTLLPSGDLCMHHTNQ